ncbi:MAG: branched-chain amino acid ABC transporter permease [Bradyrhizobium sp.]
MGKYVYFALALAMLLVAPMFIKSKVIIDLLILCNIYAVFLSSWDLVGGYTGQISFGHSLFIGGGAYTAGLLNYYFQVPPYVTIPLGGMVAAALALLIGVFALRVKGAYLALVTFAAAAVPVTLTATFWEYSGGDDGLSGIAPLSVDVVTRYYLSVALLVLCGGILIVITRSSYGLVLLSIRDDETASMAVGIDARKYKVITFVISGFLAGIAGAFYCHNQLHVDPAELKPAFSILVVLLAVAGGMGTIIGPMLSGYFLILLNEWLRFAENYKMMIYTGVIVIILLLCPRGLYPAIASGIKRVIHK